MFRFWDSDEPRIGYGQYREHAQESGVAEAKESQHAGCNKHLKYA